MEPSPGKTYDVTLPIDTTGLAARLAADGVNVRYQANWLDGLGSWLPTLLLVGAMPLLFWWLMRGTRANASRATSFGRSRARDMQGVRCQVTFTDVAGVEEAEQEMSEVVEFLKTPDKFAALGARIPKGVLMIGPPGTGKTLLAKAVAGEAGVPSNTYVIVMAATNRPDVLDPALLRAGRFDRHVTLDVPDRRGRRAILGLHVRNKPLAPDVDLDVVARQTPGFCGADLYNLANEAAILAARANRDHLITHDFEEAIALVIAGPERKSMLLSGDEKRTVAYHEAGHTLVMKILPGCDHVRRVSIISRGSALGWTLGLPDQDRRLLGDDVLRDQLTRLMDEETIEEDEIERIVHPGPPAAVATLVPA